MGIVTESYVPKLILQLNSIQKMVNYKGVEREITDTYWTDHIGPLLYPNWDTDKDKLIQLNYYDTGAFHAKRRKFVKDHSTGEYKWRDYEMEAGDSTEAQAIFDKLKEAFYLMDSVERESFQSDLSEAYYASKNISWHGIRLVRNFLLSDSDWALMPDAQISEEEKELWLKYRQKLREIPQVEQYAEPTDVKFPINPTDWNNFYEKEEGEVYLETVGQYMRLSGFYLNHYKERVVQYLMMKQSILSPTNYKNYADMMKTPNFFPNGSPSAQSSDEFVDEVLNFANAEEGGETP